MKIIENQISQWQSETILSEEAMKRWFIGMAIILMLGTMLGLLLNF